MKLTDVGHSLVIEKFVDEVLHFSFENDVISRSTLPFPMNEGMEEVWEENHWQSSV